MLFFSLGLTPPVYSASPGDLDRTFSGDGRAEANFGESLNVPIIAMALQKDGKIVVVGNILPAMVPVTLRWQRGRLCLDFSPGSSYNTSYYGRCNTLAQYGIIS